MKCILLLVLMLVFFITPSTFAANGNVYENQEYKFRITFPDDWKTKERNRPIIEARPPMLFPLISIFGHYIDDPKSISDIDEWVTKDIQKDYPNLILIEKRHLNIATHDAVQIVLRDNIRYNILYFFTNENYFYMVITMGLSSNLDKDRESIEQIISTFEFTD